jgi:pyruvate/2-oxoglutarate dehydrogenase complex dihydrolipoamide dehydrogenase (E3) component
MVQELASAPKSDSPVPSKPDSGPAMRPDICVVGAGPGGIAAALAAVAEGVSVALVEKDRPGGANLRIGAVPSKALLAAADVYESLRSGVALGVSGAPLQVNLGKVREHILTVTEAAGRSVSPERLAAQGVTVITGAARFTDPNTLMVGDTLIRPRRMVLAVGSRPAVPDLPGLDTVETLSFADVLDLGRKPAHLLVLGAGPYALELAQALTRLGMDTSVIDEGPVLPGEDPELAALVVDRLRAEGVRVRAGVKIVGVAKRRGGIRLTIADPAEGEVAVDGSHLLLATGRSPDVEGLGLAIAGIEHNRDGIVVDGGLRTTNRRVYAIGDAVAGRPLAARAERQAAGVVRSILLRLPWRDDPALDPAVTFTDPPFASVGLGEAEARRRHRDLRVIRLPYAGSDRALVENLPTGLVKVIATRRGRILGAGIVGRGAPELVTTWALAAAGGLSVDSIGRLQAGYATRAIVTQSVANRGATPGLTSPWRRRIIEILRKLG